MGKRFEVVLDRETGGSFLQDNLTGSEEFPSDRQICDLLNAAYPSSYVPREQVTEGYYTARLLHGTHREPIEVMKLKETGRLHIVICGCEPEYEMGDYTDFLRIEEHHTKGIENG